MLIHTHTHTYRYTHKHTHTHVAHKLLKNFYSVYLLPVRYCRHCYSPCRWPFCGHCTPDYVYAALAAQDFRRRRRPQPVVTYLQLQLRASVPPAPSHTIIYNVLPFSMRKKKKMKQKKKNKLFFPLKFFVHPSLCVAPGELCSIDY